MSLFKRKGISKALQSTNHTFFIEEADDRTILRSSPEEFKEEEIEEMRHIRSLMRQKFLPRFVHQARGKLYPKNEVVVYAYPSVDKVSKFAKGFSNHSLLIDYKKGEKCEKSCGTKPKNDPPVSDAFCVTNKMTWLDTSICFCSQTKHPDTESYLLVFYNVDDPVALLTLINFYGMLHNDDHPIDTQLLSMLYDEEYLINDEHKTQYQNCLALANRLNAKTFLSALRTYAR